ncbi:MAG: hypothetical protein P8078_02140, partial [bacterium]
FVGVDTKLGAHTITFNSTRGEDYVSNQGVQSYDIYVAEHSVVGQADDVFHEVQHAEMFSAGGADGFGNFGTIGNGVPKLHHQYMLTNSIFETHRNFLSNIGASSSFTNRIIGSLMGQAGITVQQGQMPSNVAIYIPEVKQILQKRINFWRYFYFLKV